MGHLVGQRWDQSGCVCILSKGKKMIVCFSPFCHMKPYHYHYFYLNQINLKLFNRRLFVRLLPTFTLNCNTTFFFFFFFLHGVRIFLNICILNQVTSINCNYLSGWNKKCS